MLCQQPAWQALHGLHEATGALLGRGLRERGVVNGKVVLDLGQLEDEGDVGIFLAQPERQLDSVHFPVVFEEGIVGDAALGRIRL